MSCLSDGLESSYEEYERACEERRAENEGYLNEFEEWLIAAGLSDKTIQRHLSNVDFFINTYLLREDAYGIEEGRQPLGKTPPRSRSSISACSRRVTSIKNPTACCSMTSRRACPYGWRTARTSTIWPMMRRGDPTFSASGKAPNGEMTRRR